MSNGIYTIRGSNVLGWFQLPYTQKEILRLANTDADFTLGSESGFQVRARVRVRANASTVPNIGRERHPRHCADCAVACSLHASSA